MVLVDLAAAKAQGCEARCRQFAVAGDQVDEVRHQLVLDLGADVEQHEFGVAVVLGQSNRVAPGSGFIHHLDEGPSVDPDLQVERLHRFFMGVTVTFEAHVGSMNGGSHTVQVGARKHASRACTGPYSLASPANMC